MFTKIKTFRLISRLKLNEFSENLFSKNSSDVLNTWNSNYFTVCKCRSSEKLDKLFSTNKLNIKCTIHKERKYDEPRSVMRFTEFEDVENKDRKSFHELISLYEENFPSRKGVVDFIHAALNHLKEFGVQKDIETYKKLIDLMPKGKLIPTNSIQAGFFHYLREQDCILLLLSHMERNAVIPDPETVEMLSNIFGTTGRPTEKSMRMLYWFPKFKNKSPWPLEKILPNNPYLLAELAIKQITSVDIQTQISIYRTEKVEAAIDHTWIVSGQSPRQRELLSKADKTKPVVVEGGDYVWLREYRVNYFLLKSDKPNPLPEPESNFKDLTNLQGKFLNPNYKPKVVPSVHEQEDGTIFAVCATGTSSKDSLLSWIRMMEEDGNPILADLAVLFRFRTPDLRPVPFSDKLTDPRSQSANN